LAKTLEELAKAKAHAVKTEKGLADANNVITSKDYDVSSLKEQVNCVLERLCLFVCMFANVESCSCVCVFLCVREREREREMFANA